MKIDVVKQIKHAGNITLQLMQLAFIIIYATQYAILLKSKTSSLNKVWIAAHNISACTVRIWVT
jgi:hypothetical protein